MGLWRLWRQTCAQTAGAARRLVDSACCRQTTRTAVLYVKCTCLCLFSLIAFCRVDRGEQLQGRSCSNVRWDTWTSSFGWPVLGAFVNLFVYLSDRLTYTHTGIWKRNAEPNDVVSVARSVGGALLSVGDCRGRVSLYRYPSVAEGVCHSPCYTLSLLIVSCYNSQSKARRICTHGSAVRGVTFSPGDGFVASVGDGGAVFVYRVVPAAAAATTSAAVSVGRSRSPQPARTPSASHQRYVA